MIRLSAKLERRWPLLTLIVALISVATWQSALACACCSATGERTDLVTKLDANRADQLGQLRFDPAATLFLGEADPESVKGIATPSEKYQLQAAWQGNRLVFSFRDNAGRSGTLSLTRPATIAIFHVDQRDQPDAGLGPVLYKEWRLTSPAIGTGVFTPGLGATQTLVLQGRGNNCTSAENFTHWMLVMSGPKAKYHFFGSFLKSS